MISTLRCGLGTSLFPYVRTVTNLRWTVSAIHYREAGTTSDSPATSRSRTADDRLIRRNDFRGVASRNRRQISPKQPETQLTLLQESLRRHARVSGYSMFLEILTRLENNDEKFIAALKKGSDRWPPMLVLTCGVAMSNVHRSARGVILDRLWKQFDEHAIPITVSTFNNRLAVLLENDSDWSAKDELDHLLNIRKLEPNQDTFYYLLERLARQGDVESCRNMVYEMARHGCVVEARNNASLVYCFAFNGHNAKADSLTEQARNKYDYDAHCLAQGACARAAAQRGDTTRLREILRRSIDGKRKLIIPADALFDTIWILASKSEEGYGAESAVLTEQILNHISRRAGFFHLMNREIERHISHDKYYTALTMLEDIITRLSDCLRNQERFTFMKQLLGRLCHQLIRNQTPIEKIHDIANRVVAIFKDQPHGPRIHDDLLLAALTYKDLTNDQRIDYLTSFVDSVDRGRERHHILLPLLAACEMVEDRLKVLFRCSVIGYKDISQLPTAELSQLVLKPLYDMQRGERRGESKLDRTAKILKSFGVPDEPLWQTIHAWYKLKESEESRMAYSEDEQPRPLAREMKGWLRFNYSLVYEMDDAAKLKKLKPVVTPVYSRLKTLVDNRESSKVAGYLNAYGWPADCDFAEIVPPIIELFVDHEDWETVKKMLVSLAAQSASWQRADEPTFSPVRSCHLLSILRRMATEGEQLDFRQMIDYSYELKRLFPHATTNYNGFFETLFEYNRLFYKCFDRMRVINVDTIDACMDLLRTLIKLDIVSLHPNETLTSVFVLHVLKRLGFEEGLNTWMKFQSSLSCSNGIVSLLRYCITQKDASGAGQRNIQYILHKAQNFIPQSRVYAIYTAVLVSMRQSSEAELFMQTNAESMAPLDLVHAFRLLNALKFKSMDDRFVLEFPELCLKYTKLSGDEGAARAMQTDWMRMCEQRQASTLALLLYEMFKKSGVDLDEKDKKRLWEIVGKHEEMAKRWIYEPRGMLQIKEDDEFCKEGASFKIKEDLKHELDVIMTRERERKSSIAY